MPQAPAESRRCDDLPKSTPIFVCSSYLIILSHGHCYATARPKLGWFSRFYYKARPCFHPKLHVRPEALLAGDAFLRVSTLLDDDRIKPDLGSSFVIVRSNGKIWTNYHKYSWTLMNPPKGHWKIKETLKERVTTSIKWLIARKNTSFDKSLQSFFFFKPITKTCLFKLAFFLWGISSKLKATVLYGHIYKIEAKFIYRNLKLISTRSFWLVSTSLALILNYLFGRFNSYEIFLLRQKSYKGEQF